MNEVEISGGEFCDNLLTGFPEEKRSSGRPLEIDNETLRRVLVELNFSLEQNWGTIGWELRQVKTIPDIRHAFKQVTQYNCSRIDVFRHEPTLRTTSKALRKLRDELTQIRCQTWNASEAVTEAKRACERAFDAVATENDHTARAKIQSLRPGLADRFEEAATAYEASRARWIELRSSLSEQEASFAQAQLFDFIQSGRYEFTPMNIARAMAGIPYISARISYERCSLLKEITQPGLAYLIFQVIESVFSPEVPAKSDGLCRIREIALSGRLHRPSSHISELQKTWYYLESAIESVYATGVLPRGSVPFRVFAEYKRRSERPNRTDVFLAEANGL